MRILKHLFIGLSIVLTITANAQSERLHIVVDERMELLTIVQYLSDYPILTQADIQYKKDIDAYFKNYRQHPAVSLNRKIYRRMFGFDAPPTYIYHFSFPDFKPIADFDKEDIESYSFMENKDTLDMLRNAFRDFYVKTDFHRFYTAHRGFYDSLLRPVQQKMAATDVINVMEAHYGRKAKAYYIVLVPLLHSGGYGPQVHVADGDLLYAILGPKGEGTGMPEFDMDYLISDYVLHEFSHSFCNPLVDQYMPQLAKDSCLLKPILASQKEQGYGRWTTCLKEHMVRANEVVLTEKVLGKEKADEAYNNMVQNDQWIYLEGLVPVVKQYLANRQRYKTADDMMPLVLNYFDEQAKRCE